MPTVLVVDDHVGVRNAIRIAFESVRGLVVCEAVDGRDAIEKARQLRPDAVILDFSMPVLNGLQAARILKKLMPGVPLFMLTALYSSQLNSEARGAGISSVYAKGADLSALVNQVRSVVVARGSN
jgi:DNA-binding NarL/FixJ family response regulator